MEGEVDSGSDDFGQESGPVKDWIFEQVGKFLKNHVHDCGVGCEEIGKPGRVLIQEDDAARDNWSGEVVREELVELVIACGAAQIESGHGVGVKGKPSTYCCQAVGRH